MITITHHAALLLLAYDYPQAVSGGSLAPQFPALLKFAHDALYCPQGNTGFLTNIFLLYLCAALDYLHDCRLVGIKFVLRTNFIGANFGAIGAR